MQHTRVADLPLNAPITLVACPECQSPMILVRILPALNDQAPLGAFYCSPCQFASTVALDLSSA
jgi:hypothetical protein